MRTLLSLVVIILSWGGMSMAYAGSKETESRLLHLVNQHVDAQTQFDSDTLTSITDESYMEVSPAGEVDPRAKMLEFYAPEHKRPGPDVAFEEPKIRIYGDTAVILGKLTYSMTLPQGDQRHFAMRGTWVAVKIGADWKLVSAQFTAIR